MHIDKAKQALARDGSPLCIINVFGLEAKVSVSFLHVLFF
ncbi:hypothetical protein CLV51_10755 [Chitinophaga niastensis]|uniref:Uncharacterized protein n=1 Tax=Chitinophaga niastensis TaxID=536980 RepID=A0A2P8HBY4_CHINA|nr:hypothetical protein CLV51_10755 [Chitinophaga niastensis]